MALNTFKSNHLMPLHFKGLIPVCESKTMEVLKYASLEPCAADTVRLLTKSEVLERTMSISRDRSSCFESSTNRPK